MNLRNLFRASQARGHLRRHHLLLNAPLLIGILLLFNIRSISANADITIAFDGMLTLNTNAVYTMVHCPSEHVAVNGTELVGDQAMCTAIKAIVIQGGAGDNVMNMAAVSPTTFPNVTYILVDSGAGNDQITASGFSDTLLGGPGDDIFIGTTKEDSVDGGSGNTFFLETTQPTGPPTSLTPFPTNLVPQQNHKSPVNQPSNPLAPGLGTTFSGITLDGHITNFFSGSIPPDPIAAAGPNHVVSVVNTAIEWYTKVGTLQSSQTLATFFSSVSPATSTFDPKVIYDQYEDRFVVVTLERTTSPQTSRIFVAVSDDEDPNGTWYFHAINALTNIGGTNHWADYPGFAVDEEAVYITNNLFSFAGVFGGSYLWIIDKGTVGGFYAGSPAAVTVHDPPTSVGQSPTTAQPAHIFGTAPTLPTNVGTWLVRYSGFTNGVQEFLSIIRVDDPLGTPTFSHQFINIGNIDTTALGMPDAPQQSGATAIDTGDRRSLQAVWRDDSLWVMTTVLPGPGADNGEATAHWVRINTFTLASLALSDQGNIGAEDIGGGANYTFHGSVMPDACGNMGATFAASGPTIHGGAYYTGRAISDPAGTVQSTGILAAGTASYVLLDSLGRNRWGDYSGAELDPDNETDIWIFNEFATTPGLLASQWATQFGRYTFHSTGMDFGDLPAAYSITNYRTVAERPDDGARHCLSSLMLGSTIDADVDGQESSNATGDGADEDGVVRAGGSGPVGNWADGVNGGSVDVTVAGGSGCLSGWIDWGQDNSMAEAGDQVINNLFITAGGPTNIPFSIPVGTFTSIGPNLTFNSRFRLVPDRDGDTSCADQTAISFAGSAPGGEVEDYQWTFTPTAITLSQFIVEKPVANMAPWFIVLGLLLLATILLSRRRNNIWQSSHR